MAGKGKQNGGLELHEDMRHQRREWRAEYIGWVIMTLLIGAALIGLLGPGPFSEAVAGDKGSSLWIDYERVERYQAPAELKIHFRRPSEATEDTRISLNRDFYEAVELQMISPWPKATLARHDRVEFAFPADTQQGATAVTFYFHPKLRWKRAVTVWLDDKEKREFNVFVLP